VKEDIVSIVLTCPLGTMELTWFVIAYADGDEEHREGSLSDATEVARAVGLTVVATTQPGSFRWIKSPEERGAGQGATPFTSTTDRHKNGSGTNTRAAAC